VLNGFSAKHGRIMDEFGEIQLWLSKELRELVKNRVSFAGGFKNIFNRDIFDNGTSAARGRACLASNAIFA
jgi:hypothetical protein